MEHLQDDSHLDLGDTRRITWGEQIVQAVLISQQIAARSRFYKVGKSPRCCGLILPTSVRTFWKRGAIFASTIASLDNLNYETFLSQLMLV